MRLIDTGRRSAAENIALDWVLLKKRAEGKIEDTFRILQFTPSVLIGYHQCPKNEVRLSYCKKRGIQVCRRITGGGAIYFDASQIGWEIIASFDKFPKNLLLLSKRLSEGVIRALEKLGIKAEFRPRNDIEVNGRKISGMGGVYEGEAFLLQGTLLVEFDVETMLKVLKVPIEKLKKREIDSLKDRVTWISKELGYTPETSKIKQFLKEGFQEVLQEELKEESLKEDEERAWEKAKRYFSSHKWLYKIKEPQSRGVLSSTSLLRGGKVSLHLFVDLRRKIVKNAFITGDMLCARPKDIYDLEASLKDVYFDEIQEKIEEFFIKRRPSIVGIGKEGMKELANKAIAKTNYVNVVGKENVNALNVIGGSFEDILKEAEYLLLPYCAKPLSCSYRRKNGCSECGKCSVGEAYKMAKEAGLEPICINSFRNLKETLKFFKKRGTKAYIACCCTSFFIRREKVFKNANIPALFIDINRKTCFSLNKEREALAGEFEGETELKIPLLRKVLEHAKNLH